MEYEESDDGGGDRQNESPTGWIDVHHHLLPPFYVRAMEEHGVRGCLGTPFPRWSPERSLALMDRHRVMRAVLSLPAPGIYWTDDSFSRRLARLTNEYIARVKGTFPDRFYGLACLPLPDISGSLYELEHSLDALGLDGVIIMSNVRGIYASDRRYDEVFQELHRRKTVCFIHPNTPPGIDDEDASDTSPHVEWLLEMTRVTARLLKSGTLERYADISFILAYAGGLIASMASGIASERGGFFPADAGPFRSLGGERIYHRTMRILGSMTFDTATATSTNTLTALKDLAGARRMVFGTDLPWSPVQSVGLQQRQVTMHSTLSAAELKSVMWENAGWIFGRPGKPLRKKA